MNLYQIYDSSNRSLLSEYPIFEGKRPIEALKKYLNYKNINVSVKISADIDVRFGVIPCQIDENGKVWQLGYKRKTWFKATRKEGGEMKHTLGPWKVVGSEIWAGSRRITMGRGAYDEKDRKIRDANAHLIAAAPELLEACKLLVREMQISRDGSTLLKNVNLNSISMGLKAIAKAEGRDEE